MTFLKPSLAILLVAFVPVGWGLPVVHETTDPIFNELYGDTQAFVAGTPPAPGWGDDIHALTCRRPVPELGGPHLVSHPLGACFYFALGQFPKSVVEIQDASGLDVGGLAIVFHDREARSWSLFCGEDVVEFTFGHPTYAQLLVYPMDHLSSLEHCGVPGGTAGFITRVDAPAGT